MPLEIPWASEPTSKGTWWRGGPEGAWIQAPCGHHINLGRLEGMGGRYTIKRDGTVSPEVVCPRICPWRSELRLLEWGTQKKF